MRGLRYTNEDVFFFAKKHFCPLCGQKLEKIIKSKIVKRTDNNAYKYNFDFNHPGGPLVGDIKKAKFAWNEYKCACCNKHFTIEQLQSVNSDENSDEKSESDPVNHKKGLLCFFLIALVLCIGIFSIKYLLC